MNTLMISGHPAQVHNFRNLKSDLEKKGHRVFWLATDKDISKYLLNYYKIRYEILGRPGKSLFSKIFILIRNTLVTVRFIRKNHIDCVFSRVSPYATIACFLLGKKHFALTDTETAGFYDKFFGRFATVLFTSKSFKRDLRPDQIRFDGNIELFYLHPNRFNPVSDVSELLGIKKGEPYVILRFVSWAAYHDKGLTGFTEQNKIKAIHEFSRYSKVFISSEKVLSTELDPYRINIPFEKMHDVLANATLYFGEAATMASESAILGTPAVYLNENWLGYTDEEERYGLLYSFKSDERSQEAAIEKGIELLKNQDLREEVSKKKEAFLKDKIDVTAFMSWFVENYPDSLVQMKKDPRVQYSFR